MSDIPTGPGGPGFFDRLRAALRGVDPSQVADDASQAAGDIADGADHGIAGAINRLRRRRGKKAAAKGGAAGSGTGSGGGIKARIEELRRQRERETQKREREAQRERRREREQPRPPRTTPPAAGRGGLSQAIEERRWSIDRGKAAAGDRPEDDLTDEDQADLIISGTPLAGAPWVLTGPNNEWLILGNAALVEPNLNRTGLNSSKAALIDWAAGWKGGNDWIGSGVEYSAIAILNWREPANWLWRSYSQSNNKASTLLGA